MGRVQLLEAAASANESVGALDGGAALASRIGPVKALPQLAASPAFVGGRCSRSRRSLLLSRPHALPSRLFFLESLQSCRLL